MDFDLLKLYKEYEELNAKLSPLRTEYNFLIEDIEKKRTEHETFLKSISSIKESVEKEKSELQQKIDKFNIDMENAKKSFDINKNKEVELYNKQLNVSKDELVNIDKQIKEKTILSNKLSIDIIEQEKKLELLKIENWEYSQIIIKNTEDNKKTIEELKQKKQDLKDTQKEFEEKQEQFKKDEEKWKRLKENIDIDNKNISKYRSELEQKTLENNKQLELIQVKQDELKQSEKSAQKTLEETESKLSELKWKETEIAKKITEFQEEKYRFLVIMKQRDIKKTDLDKLDKDFTL